MHPFKSGQPLFRIWIATYADWRPGHWNDAPPRATALELVDDAAYSAEEAALFLQGFNTAMLEEDRPIWAIAVPVVVRYEGDAQVGGCVRGFVFAEPTTATAAP
jgi:hypothetical protein